MQKMYSNPCVLLYHCIFHNLFLKTASYIAVLVRFSFGSGNWESTECSDTVLKWWGEDNSKHNFVPGVWFCCLWVVHFSFLGSIFLKYHFRGGGNNSSCHLSILWIKANTWRDESLIPGPVVRKGLTSWPNVSVVAGCDVDVCALP